MCLPISEMLIFWVFNWKNLAISETALNFPIHFSIIKQLKYGQTFYSYELFRRMFKKQKKKKFWYGDNKRNSRHCQYIFGTAYFKWFFNKNSVKSILYFFVVTNVHYDSIWFSFFFHNYDLTFGVIISKTWLYKCIWDALYMLHNYLEYYFVYF